MVMGWVLTASVAKTEDLYLASIDSPASDTPSQGEIIEPTRDRLRIQFGSAEDNRRFNFGFGSRIGIPSALQGPTRRKVVPTSATQLVVFPVPGFLQFSLSDNSRLLLEILGDTEALGVDLSYSVAPSGLPGVFTINTSGMGSLAGAFEGGDPVTLPDDRQPFVHRLGGGIEYLERINPQLDVAAAINFEQISIKDSLLGEGLEPIDEFGNPLTIAAEGRDHLLMLSLVALYSTLDDRAFPTRGSRIGFGIDQTIPIGSERILFTRLNTNFTHFLPVNLFGFGEGTHTLVFNLQGGTMLGDVPPYEAYAAGGGRSVRGFENGGVATGSSLLQTSLEYRYPIASFNQVDLGGSLFVDYANDLGSAEDVVGEPGSIRNKPGEGLGYGLGLRARSPIGLWRVEYARTNRGEDEVHINIGQNF
jgi:outer membrane protein insertion porin family